MAIVTGILFGIIPTAYLYVVENYDGSSKNGLDYIFSVSTGILISAVVYFLIYCIIKKNRPQINHQLAFPGIISGLMWGMYI